MKAESYAGQVLVVDDDPIMAELLSAELEEAGFRATAVADLAALQKKVKERFFDVVLLDLFLEKADGLEALPFLAQHSPYTKIIVMSAHGTVELAVSAMEQGATTFICKSKNSKEMVEALRTRLESSQSEEQNIPEGATGYGIIGHSPATLEVLAKIEQVKDVDSTVLIMGESGTGKELVARALHRRSTRAASRFEAVNCGAIPEHLLESELFGHRRGAFTDAKADRKGLFELCQDGTLFLDEIGELPHNLQVKILRVLQEREVMPLGSGTPVAINTRVVAATNRNLTTEVEKGNFRADLYYRLAVLQIALPPLKERREDVIPLVDFFLKRFNERFKKNVLPPSKEIEVRMLAHEWPGNIRELQNAIERAVVLSTDNKLHLEDLLLISGKPENRQENIGEPAPDYWLRPLSEAKQGFEKAYLQHLLELTRGNISEMARISGRYRADIYRLLTKYGVIWEEFRP